MIGFFYHKIYFYFAPITLIIIIDQIIADDCRNYGLYGKQLNFFFFFLSFILSLVRTTMRKPTLIISIFILSIQRRGTCFLLLKN